MTGRAAEALGRPGEGGASSAWPRARRSRGASRPARTWARRALRAVAAATLLLLATAAAAIAWLRLQDPVAALPRLAPGARASLVELNGERWRDRTLLHVALDGGAIGRVRFIVSLPHPLPDHRLPVVIVLGGLGGGADSIRALTDAGGDLGPNAVIGYDWPLPRKLPGALWTVLHAPGLRRHALTAPGQVDALLRWASSEPWADTSRVSLLGFSFGAFPTAAVQRIVEAGGTSVRFTVLGYFGATIGAVVAAHPGVKPRWLAPLLGAFADLMLRPVDPSVHLSHLRGRFLVLEARSDRLIAPAAAARARELTPQPRTVIVVEGDHMGVGPAQRLLARVIRITRAWLVEQGALVPAGRAAAPAVRPAPVGPGSTTAGARSRRSR
ncbi:hypothetical protein [Anaeromyxobacter oryzisoli]|uniref:hypothetical protein n=1 Tax=Anaeromyxobacter oryzisoli TaxID=2925408 RepID=UPI001F58684E|nr:hypothetical protein [Anaeromyxobacter sp. SG63]